MGNRLKGVAIGDVLGSSYFNQEEELCFPFGYFFDSVQNEWVLLLGRQSESHKEMVRRYCENHDVDFTQCKFRGRLWGKKKTVGFWDEYGIPKPMELKSLLNNLGIAEYVKFIAIDKDWNDGEYDLIPLEEYYGVDADEKLCRKYGVDNVAAAREYDRIWNGRAVDEGKKVMKITENKLRNIIHNAICEEIGGERYLEFEESMALAHALLLVRNDFYIFRPEDLSRPVNTAGNSEIKGDIVRDLLRGYGKVVKEDDETLYVLLTDLGNRQKYVIEGNKALMEKFYDEI